MLARMKNIYYEYPRNFWVIIGATFIDQIGGALIFPFLALYITARYGVGMTEVGKIFAIVAFTGIFGSGLGGALADKFGRKKMIIFGLVVSATVTISLAFAPNIQSVYLLCAFIGIFAHMGGPARQALMADILPENKRADGFGLLRVVANLAVAIGPAIGGFIAQRSYLWLFVLDAIASTITASIVYVAISETKPAPRPVEQGKESTPHREESLLQTIGGYNVVLRDGLFVAFWVASLLMVLAYMQMNSTLSVYLRDVHGIPAQGYGWLLTLNASMVVLFQFAITRRVKKFAPMLVMVAGTFLYMVGFTMIGFVSAYIYFLLAMVIITAGEMLVAPIGEALAAKFAPEEMRGRYMAIYSFHWAVPTMFGPWAAGIIMDNFDPNWVWYACGIVLALSMSGYLLMHLAARDRLKIQADPEEKPIIPLTAPVSGS